MDTPKGNRDNCRTRIIQARKQGFASGRRVGLWLAFNGPQAVAQARQLDQRARQAQDRAIEGLGDVFAGAEQGARAKDVGRRAGERYAERLRDRQARERQDQAMEGLGDVFARAEQRPVPPDGNRARLIREIFNDKSIDSLSKRAVAVGIRKPRELFKGPAMMSRIRQAIIERL